MLADILGVTTGNDASTEGLSSSEHAVIRAALEGRTNAEIARARNTSVRTVANQIASAFRKLGVHSRGELAARTRFWAASVEPSFEETPLRNQRTADSASAPGPVALRRLGQRERQAVALASFGHANKFIASELGISVSAVSVYLTRAARKLGATSRVALAHLYRNSLLAQAAGKAGADVSK